MNEQPRSLVRKLCEVQKSVERIPKNGRNEFHKYDYATESDIVSAIRTELADRNVMLIPSVTGERRASVGEKGSWVTTLDMSFEFYDGDSGETIAKPWMGFGSDKEDKGGYKAMTGGAKYFLLKTFLIPTGDDPESDSSDIHPQAKANSASRAAAGPRADAVRQAARGDATASVARPAPTSPGDTELPLPRSAGATKPTAQSMNGALITENQGKRFFAIAKGKGLSPVQMKEWLSEVFQIEGGDRNIPARLYEDVIKALQEASF